MTGKRASTWLWDTAVAVVWPPAIVDVAAKAPNWWCVLTCITTGSLVVGTWAAGHATSAAEPFRDLGVYFAEGFKASMILAGIAFLGGLAILLPGVLGVAWSFFIWKRRAEPPFMGPKIRTYLVGVLPIVPWVLAGFFASMLWHAQSSGFGLWGRPKPAWLLIPIWGPASFVFSPLVLGPICVAYAWRASLVVAARCDPAKRGRQCPCGYELTGITGAVCPECGERRTPESEATL